MEIVREKQVIQVFRKISASQSIEIIAPSGYGKSYFLSQIKDEVIQDETKKKIINLGDIAPLFVEIDIRNARVKNNEYTLSSLYELLINALYSALNAGNVADEVVAYVHDHLTNLQARESKNYSYISDVLPYFEYVTKHTPKFIYIVIDNLHNWFNDEARESDQFARVPDQFWNNLDSMRDKFKLVDRKRRIAFMFISNHSKYLLTGSAATAPRTFMTRVRVETIHLPLYDLREIGSFLREESPDITDEKVQWLYAIAHGHPRLTRAVLYSQQADKQVPVSDALLNNLLNPEGRVQDNQLLQYCDELYHSFSEDEQLVLRDPNVDVAGQVQQIDRGRKYLTQKGIYDSTKITIPIFSTYLKQKLFQRNQK